MEGAAIPAFSLLLFVCASFDFVLCLERVTATCELFNYELGSIIGQVNFTQQLSSGEVKIKGCISDLPPGEHGFHVHQYGALFPGCLPAGGHFNPEGKTHGDILDTERHVGDLGNLNITSSEDFCFPEFSDNLISLLPGKHSIIGRVLAVHRDRDDLGRGHFNDSKTTGHSGPRVACCVIGLTSDLPSGTSSQFLLAPYSTLLALLLLSVSWASLQG